MPFGPYPQDAALALAGQRDVAAIEAYLAALQLFGSRQQAHHHVAGRRRQAQQAGRRLARAGEIDRRQQGRPPQGAQCLSQFQHGVARPDLRCDI
jgi:hypothetical protein